MLDVKCKTVLFTPNKDLNILDSPKCLQDQLLEYQATPFQNVTLSCTVLANPRENMSFDWVFNTSEFKFKDKVDQNVIKDIIL